MTLLEKIVRWATDEERNVWSTVGRLVEEAGIEACDISDVLTTKLNRYGEAIVGSTRYALPIESQLANDESPRILYWDEESDWQNCVLGSLDETDWFAALAWQTSYEETDLPMLKKAVADAESG